MMPRRLLSVFVSVIAVAVASFSRGNADGSGSSTPWNSGPWVVVGRGWNLTLNRAPDFVMRLEVERAPTVVLYGSLATVLDVLPHGMGGWYAVDGSQVDAFRDLEWSPLYDGGPQNRSDEVVFALRGTPRSGSHAAGRIASLVLEYHAYPDTPLSEDAMAFRMMVRIEGIGWHSPDANAAAACSYHFVVDGTPVETAPMGNSLHFGEAMFTASSQAKVQSPGANETTHVSLWQFHDHYWQIFHSHFPDGSSVVAETSVHELEPKPFPGRSSVHPSRHKDDEDNTMLIVACVLAVAIITGAVVGSVAWYLHTHRGPRYNPLNN